MSAPPLSGSGTDAAYRGGDRAGGTAQQQRAVKMEVEEGSSATIASSAAPAAQPPDTNGVAHSQVDSSAADEDDGQPQQKRQRVTAGTAADDGRALRVQIPGTPSRAATTGHAGLAAGGRGGAQSAEGVMAQLSRLREWQARAREEMELLQTALDTAAATAILRHDKPLTEPFQHFEASLTAAVSAPQFQPAVPSTPFRLSTSAASSFPVPPFYRSATEPFQSPYSAQASPLPPSTPSFNSPFPFPQPSSSNLPSPSSSLAQMPLDQLEARRAQLTAFISAFQRSAGALLPLGTEPPRNKTHWDYLLQEALWMSGDFQREKRWKMKVAKQLSKAVLQHWQRVREKDVRERKAEVARKRKQCAAIAREVRKFWMQIGKLVHYKHTQAVEAEKKEQMARHLELLVDQTESYSSQLAMDMRKGEERKEAAAAVEEAPREEKKEAVEEEVQEVEGSLDDILKGLNGGASPSSQSSEERSERSGRKRKRRAVDASGEAEARDEEKDGGDDYEAEESSDDDEQTLEAEEEQEEAEADDAEDRHAKAVEELNEEAEMSVEELKRKYGIGLPDNEEEEEEEEEDGENDGDAEGDEDGEQQDEQMEAEGGEDGAEEEKMADDEVIPESPPTSTSPTPTAAASSSAASHSAEEARLTAASSLASSAQPTGYTLATHKVHTRTPSLLRGSLREYQQVGLDWLASMYSNALNGILADEMGLGKTVMTIALLGWLACEKGLWGQHLIVVPTSVMINWEMEFKRFLPGLRILCYHGSAKERKEKRKGWMDPNRFHVCITSYQMILQDAAIFRRKRWLYLILDEAQNIRNFKSQRWQTLLSFNTQRRLLLTGTPLQNSVMELWSLMHFLMPAVFQSQREFREWFSVPVESMIEGRQQLNTSLIARLHTILRPFILRRLKSAVATQLPAKYEHTVYCRLSKRQRQYYEDFMAASDTRRILQSGNFLGMMNVLMQLRKCCNHPDLFAARAIVSPLDMMEGMRLEIGSVAVDIVRSEEEARRGEDGAALHHLLFLRHYAARSRLVACDIEQLQTPAAEIEDVTNDVHHPQHPSYGAVFGALPADAEQTMLERLREVKEARLQRRVDARQRLSRENARRCRCVPLLDHDDHLIRLLTIVHPTTTVHHALSSHLPLPRHQLLSYPELLPSQLSAAPPLLLTLEQRVELMLPTIVNFTCIIPRARAPPPSLFFWRQSPSPSATTLTAFSPAASSALHSALQPVSALLRPSFIRHQLSFPDRLLIQFDCGKLQVLDRMLRQLHAGRHRCLIFTQFTRMLDVLEHFLSLYSYPYLRLDGSVKAEERQRLMEKFNHNDKYFVMLLSTRSGGVGVNLTGADTVIFYDTDWNPAMDLQAQDRCHRIGQEREVNVYRLVTRGTIEENILRKSTQKRAMNDMVIGDGNFSTDSLDKLDPRELLGVDKQGDAQQAEGKAAKAEVKVEERKEDGEGVDAVVEDEEAALARVTGKPVHYSAEEVQTLMMTLEDESDRQALLQLQAEQAEEKAEFGSSSTANANAASASASAPRRSNRRTFYSKLASHNSASFESALTPVQRYALYFAEHVDPLISDKQLSKTVKRMEADEHKWAATQGLKKDAAAVHSGSNGLSDGAVKEEKMADVSSTVKLERMDDSSATTQSSPDDHNSSAHSSHLDDDSKKVQGNREIINLTNHTATTTQPTPTTTSTTPPTTSTTTAHPSLHSSSPIDSASAAPPAAAARSYKRKRVTFEDDDVLSYVDAWLSDRHYNDPQPPPSAPVPPFDLLPAASSADDDGDVLFYDYALSGPEYESRYMAGSSLTASMPSELLLRHMHEATLSQLQPVFEQRGYMFDGELYDAVHLQLDEDPYVDTALPSLYPFEDEGELPPFSTPADMQRMQGRYSDAMAFSFRAGIQSSRSKVRSQYLQYRAARRVLKEKRRERQLWSGWLLRRDRSVCAAYEAHTPSSSNTMLARERARQVIEMEVDKDGDPWVLRIPRTRVKGWGVRRHHAQQQQLAAQQQQQLKDEAAAGVGGMAGQTATGARDSLSTLNKPALPQGSLAHFNQFTQPPFAINSSILQTIQSQTQPPSTTTPPPPPLPQPSSTLPATSPPPSAKQLSSWKPTREGFFASLRPSTSFTSTVSASTSTASALLNPPRMRPPALEDINRHTVPFTAEEDGLILQLVAQHGPNWLLCQLLLCSNPRVTGRMRTVKEVQARYLLLQQRREGGRRRGADGGGDEDEEDKEDGREAAKEEADERREKEREREKDRERDRDREKDKDRSDKRDKEKEREREKERDGHGRDKESKDKKRDKGSRDKERERSREKEGKSDKKRDKLSKEERKRMKKEEKQAALQEKKKKERYSTVLLPSGYGSRAIPGFIERCMRLLKTDQGQVKATLRSSLQATSPAAMGADDSGMAGGATSKPIVQVVHASHKQAVHEAHQRYGLPASAVGKTLMPHQVIQMRMRKQQQQQDAQRQAQQRQIQQQQQQQQQMQATASQQPNGLPNSVAPVATSSSAGMSGAPVPLSTSPAPGSVSMEEKQRQAIARQYQQQQQQQGMQRPPSSSGSNNIGTSGSGQSMRPPSASGLAPPMQQQPSSLSHIPPQSRSSNMPSYNSQQSSVPYQQPPPGTRTLSNSSAGSYGQQLPPPSSSAIPLSHSWSYSNQSQPHNNNNMALSPNPAMQYSQQPNSNAAPLTPQYPVQSQQPPQSVSPVPGQQGVPASPKNGSRARKTTGGKSRAVATANSRGRMTPGGGVPGQDGSGMSVDINLIQQQQRQPGLSPPIASPQQMYNSYQPSPPAPNSYASPPAYSNPSTPSYPPQQQPRAPYPSQIAPPNHRPSTPNSQSYAQPPNGPPNSYPHPSNPYPVPVSNDYANSGRMYDPSLAMDLDPVYLQQQQQQQHSRPGSAPYPQQQLNSRIVGPASHHSQQQQQQAYYDPQQQQQQQQVHSGYEQQHMLPPSLSPSPAPSDRGVSPLPPSSSAVWLKQTYGKFPHNAAMESVLHRTDLDEQQKVQMFQHIIQRERLQQGPGGGGIRGDEASPVPMSRG